MSLRPRTDRQAPAANSVSVTGDLDDSALYGDIEMALYEPASPNVLTSRTDSQASAAHSVSLPG